MRRPFRPTLIAFAGVLVTGCRIDRGLPGEPLYTCPYTKLGAVAPDDPGELGFTATEALEAAEVATVGLTDDTRQVPTSYEVVLTHRFVREGEVSVIEFGADADSVCPVGRGLRIPVSYEIAGTIGGWSVKDTTAVSVVATAAALEAISFGRSPDPDGETWDAEVDAGLADLARSALDLTPGCDLTFSIWPQPSEPKAGAWQEELVDGGLDLTCISTGGGGMNVSAAFLRWDSPTVEPLDGAPQTPTD